MNRKRLIAGCAALVLLLPGIALVLFLHPGVVVTRERVDQILPGMTLAEVESILGGPPGNYGGEQSVHRLMFTLYDNDGTRFWVGSYGAAAVQFDQRDRVAIASFINYTGPPWYRRILGRLGL